MNRKSISPGIIAIYLSLGAASTYATLQYLDGDILIGFHATSGKGSDKSYVLDIGSFTDYIPGGLYNAVPGTTIPIGNIGDIITDLRSLYGDGSSGSPLWSSRADLLWGAAGTQKVSGNGVPSNTMFVSRWENPIGTVTPWGKPSLQSGSAAAGSIQGQATAPSGGYKNGTSGANVESTHNSVGLIEDASSDNDWASFQPNATNGAVSYGLFSDTYGIEANFGSGTPGAVLDLFRVGSTVTTSYLGSFAISDAGVISFTSAVPEPSSVAMLALGGVWLARSRRRARRSAAPTV